MRVTTRMIRSGVLGYRKCFTTRRAAVSIGVRTHEVMRFMGRDMATESEVVEYEPGRKIAFRTISGAHSARAIGLSKTREPGQS